MLILTKDDLRAIFPRAPQPLIDAMYDDRSCLMRAGILQTRRRLAYCFANVEHEVGGFALPGLTENINYTAERAAEIWPNRFANAAAVRAKYGTGPGWQKKMFDDVYGNRMGNRPGTSDGSLYIGRGAPQITGRDGYREVGARCGLPLEVEPQLAARYENQAKIIAGFILWKNLNAKADAGDFEGYVKLWNGGRIGMADRLERMRVNEPIIARLAENNDPFPSLPPLQQTPTPAPKPAPVPPSNTARAGGTSTGVVATILLALHSGSTLKAACIVIAGAVISFLIWKFWPKGSSQ